MAKKGRVGALSVSLSLNSAQFTTALKKARKRTSAFGKSIAAGTFRLAKYGAAIGAAGVALGTYFTKQSFRSIDATAKLADRLGITTRELTGLQHAATIMGSSAEGMNKSLEQFSRRIGEAQTGTGEALDTFEQLGLSAKELAETGLAESFKIAAERIAALRDQTAKADAAYNLFGRRGMELLNTLSLGRKGLEDVAREADVLGFSFSRVDAAKVEEANDSIARLKGVFRGAFNVLATQLAPFVTALAQGLIGAGKAGGGMAQSIQVGFETALVVVGKVADSLVWIRTQFARVALAINALTKPLVQALIWLDDLTKKLPGGGGGKTGDALRNFAETLEQNMQYWSDVAAKGESGPRPSERLAAYVANVRESATERARDAIAPTAGGPVAVAPATLPARGRDDGAREQRSQMIAAIEGLRLEISGVGKLL